MNITCIRCYTKVEFKFIQLNFLFTHFLVTLETEIKNWKYPLRWELHQKRTHGHGKNIYKCVYLWKMMVTTGGRLKYFSFGKYFINCIKITIVYTSAMLSRKVAKCQLWFVFLWVLSSSSSFFFFVAFVVAVAVVAVLCVLMLHYTGTNLFDSNGAVCSMQYALYMYPSLH